MNCFLPNRFLILWFILFLHLKAPLYAQETSFVQLAKMPEFAVVPGEKQLISVFFRIRDGYHIQADRVKDENLIPTVLSFDDTEGMIIGDPDFPQAVEFWMKGADDALMVFSDILEINIPVMALESIDKEPLLIRGRLHYQACDDSKCYFPRDFDFKLKIKIKQNPANSDNRIMGQ